MTERLAADHIMIFLLEHVFQVRFLPSEVLMNSS